MRRSPCGCSYAVFNGFLLALVFLLIICFLKFQLNAGYEKKNNAVLGRKIYPRNQKAMLPLDDDKTTGRLSTDDPIQDGYIYLVRLD